MRKYLAYDLELYALIKTLKHWRPNLIHHEFILFRDHYSLEYLHSQHNLSAKHAQWLSYLQQFNFVIKHKTKYENKVADAFSHRPHSLVILSTSHSSFASMKNCHSTNLDFK